MSIKNQESPQEEKAIIKGAGCLNLFLAMLIPICALPVFADKTHIVLTLGMSILTFVGLTLAIQGLFILSIPILIIKAIFGRNTDKYLDDRKFEKSRVWVVFPIGIILFYLGNLLLSGTPNDNIAYPAIGFAYALALYIMTKMDYFHPADYEVTM